MKPRYYVIFISIGVVALFPVISIVFYDTVPVGINFRYFEKCEECELDPTNTSDQLKEIIGNCNCQTDPERTCPQPFIDWENSTHYIDNNICEWREKKYDSKTLECFSLLFHCDASSEYFEGCISGKKDGMTIEEICTNATIEIDDGCATLPFDDNNTMITCE